MKNHSISSSEEEEEVEEEDTKTIGSPWCFIILKHNSTVVSLEHKFSIYKELLMSKAKLKYHREDFIREAICKRAIQSWTLQSWCIILCKSGAMATGIFDPLTGELTFHKVLKRYTSRKQQGGSQMIRDKSGLTIGRSAGSQIRRENEKAWMEDMEQLFMVTLKSRLQDCGFLFISASYYLLPFFHKTVFIDDLQNADKSDRIRSIPFTTYEPNLTEIQRCFLELIQLQSPK